ncbi:hypothetical protein [Pedobacter panaciterrae]
MKKTVLVIFTLLVQFFNASAQQINLKTDDLSLSISQTGQVAAMLNPKTGKNYLAIGEKAPLLSVRVAEEWEEPAQAVFNSKSGVIILNFMKAKVSAEIKVVQKKTHLVFELIRLNTKDKVNAVVWGAYPTIIGQTIGEVVGVVRDGEYAIGLQSLNVKTIGGVLKNAEGADYSRGSVAVSQSYGSSLQAFSLDRSKDRKITVWNQYPNMLRLMQYPMKLQ